MKLGASNLSIEEWEDLLRKITFWELELERSGDAGMKQILEMQKSEANAQFFKYHKIKLRIVVFWLSRGLAIDVTSDFSSIQVLLRTQ